jgi:hypothetical protein
MPVVESMPSKWTARTVPIGDTERLGTLELVDVPVPPQAARRPTQQAIRAPRRTLDAFMITGSR